MDKSSTTTVCATLLAVIHGMLGSYFGLMVVVGVSKSYPQIPCAFLLTLSHFAIVWALIFDRRWGIIFQIGLYSAYVISWPHDVEPLPGDWIGWEVRLLLAQVIIILFLLVELATTILFITRLSTPLVQRERTFASAILGFEAGYLLVSIVAVIWGDVFWAPQKVSKRQERLEKARELEEIKVQQESLRPGEVFSALRLAIEAKDGARLEAATSEAIEVADTYIEERQEERWKAALESAGSKVHILMAKQLMDGKIKSEWFLSVLEKAATDPQAVSEISIIRTRDTVTTMYAEDSGDRRKMGALKGRSHARVVAQLAAAISDREHTSIQERIDLALAIEETADLKDFDAKPAAAALKRVVESGDDERVRKAAAAALVKAEIDEDRR